MGALRAFFAAVIFVAVSVNGPVVAAPFEDGIAAYGRGDFPAALRLIRPLAERGHASARAALGVMYGAGRGVPQDDAEALRWYRLAAEEGEALAQFNLGVM